MGKFKCEISKMFYLPLFCISCIGIAGICLLSECYADSTGRSYTVIEMMFNSADIDMLDMVSMNNLAIWRAGLGSWTYLLLPLLLSMGYLFVLSEERRTGAIRQQLIREGNFRYCLSKIAGAIVCSGILMVTGYALYGIVVWKCFPSLYAYDDSQISAYMEYMPDGAAWFVIRRMIGVFLYGIYVNAFAVGVSIVFVDRYILLCLPMMLNYIYSQVIAKIEADAFSRDRFDFAEKIQFLRMENIIGIGQNDTWVFTLLLMAATYIILFALFWFLITKRSDSGGWE